MLCQQSNEQALLSVSLSAGLLSNTFEGNYKEMAPRMCLVDIGVAHRCGRNRCEEKEITRQDWWVWDRQTEGEIEFDSNVWLAWLAMENLTEHGIPTWAWENTPSSGLWLCEEYTA